MMIVPQAYNLNDAHVRQADVGKDLRKVYFLRPLWWN